MAKRKTKKFSSKKLTERLKGPTEPPPCICEPISMGCKCGRFQWEQSQKHTTLLVRSIALTPEIGDVYKVGKPPNTEVDYSSVPYRVWLKCEGQLVEVDAVEEDNNVPGIWWCWCDVSSITKQGGDEHWFPNDGLLKLHENPVS